MIKVAINTVSFRTPHLRRAVVHYNSTKKFGFMF